MVRPQGTLICNEINEDLHIQNKKIYSHLEELNKISCIPQTDIFESQEVVHISQYNEMLKCTESDTRIEDEQKRYDDDPSLLYGYISAANYELSTTPANVAYKTMPLVLDKHNTNAVSEELSEKVPHSFEFQSDIRSKICQLSVHPQTSQVLHLKEEIIPDVANDDCSVIKWRTPNLSEVISFLSNPNSEIQANAAAYLQHLCYMDDPNKQRTRTLGGILPLVRLLSSEKYDVHKNACGALRNLSYGRQNDENKRAIKNAGGVSALINLLCRTKNIELKELITGVIWNMSSCEDLKRFIIDDGLSAIVTKVIKPNSGWDPLRPTDVCYSTVFRNASGVLRNISSAGEYARTMLRNSDYLVQCLFHIIRMSIERNNIGTKIVENCVCVLRNLSYRCQEVEDPNYDKFTAPASTLSLSKGENKGCFGTSKKRKESIFCESKNSFSISSVTASNSLSRYMPNKELEQLWQPDVVTYYLTLLQSCSNPETLEAAAGAIQNLTACYWQPSIDIRAAVRKEKGLPILVELLRMEVDRVVCAVATALRNLAIDQRNKELIGKYAMRDLIQKLPSANTHDIGLSDETISAVLATINEVIKRTPEFARTLLDADGVERLMNISGQRQQYTSSVLKFADQVLLTMWQHNELRDVFKKHGWKEQDFITKNFPVRSTAFNSSNNANSTLNRPMASQSHTRYEDKTIRRIPNNSENARNNGHFPIVNEFPSSYHIKSIASHDKPGAV